MFLSTTFTGASFLIVNFITSDVTGAGINDSFGTFNIPSASA